MNTEEELRQAQTRLTKAQNDVERLIKRREFEQSFGGVLPAYMVTRRDISSGRLLSVVAVFSDENTATRFRDGQVAWREAGFGVEPIDLYHEN